MGNNRIRIVIKVTGVVTTLPKYNIGFNALGGKFTANSICVDSANNLYFPNSLTRQICKMSSDGNLTSWPATFSTVGMAIYKDTTLYITDGTRITPMSITDGSVGTPITLAGCSCIAVSPVGYMYVSASTSVVVYNLKTGNSVVRTMQISRPGTFVVSSVDCMCVDPDCNLYVGITSGTEFRICKYDSGGNLKAATVNLSSKVTGLVFSKGSLYYLRNYSIYQTNGTENTPALYNGATLIFNSSLFTGISVVGKGIQGQVCDAAYGNTTTLNKPAAIAADINGAMYIVDEAVKSPAITQVTSIIIKSTNYIPLQSGLLYNIAGTNAPGNITPNLSAYLENFSSIQGVCYDSVGNMYVADSALNTVSKIDLTGKLTTFAGQIDTVGGYTGDGGVAATAKLRGPTDIKMSKSDVLYIADTGNNAIRRVKLVGGTNYNIETFISSVTSPTALTIDSYENIYVVTGTSTISVISPLTGALTNVVNAGFNVNALAVNTANQLFYTGNGRINRVGGTSISGFTQPTGLVIDDANTIYVSDVAANKVFSISGGTSTNLIGNGLQETPVSITEGLAENIYGNGAPPLFRAFSAPGALSIKPSRGGLLVAQPTKVSLLSGTTTNLTCGTQANSFTIRNTGAFQIFLSQVVALDTTGTNILLKSAAQSYFDGFYGCKSNAKAHVIRAGQNLVITLPANTTVTCILLYFGASYKTGWNGVTLQFGSSYTRYIQGVTDTPGSQYALFDYRTKTPACIPFINYVNKYKLQTTASPTTETYRVQYARYVRITSFTSQMTAQRIYAIHGETGEDLLFGKVPYLNTTIKAICLVGDITNIGLTTTTGATQVFPSSNSGGITNFWIEYDLGDEYPVEQIIIQQLAANTGRYSVSLYAGNRAQISFPNLLDSQIQTIQMDSGVTITPAATAGNIQSRSQFTIGGFTVPTGLVPSMLRLQNSAQQEIGRVGLTYTPYKYTPPALPSYLGYYFLPIAGIQQVRYVRISGLIQLSQILVLDSNGMNVSYGKTATSSVGSSGLNLPVSGSDGAAFRVSAIVATHATSFNGPFGLAIDSAGSIFVTDFSNNRIQKVTSGGTVSTLAGSGSAGSTDGTGATASFNGPTGVTVDSAGNVIITEYTNNSLRRISTAAATYGQVTTLGSFAGACGAAVDLSGNIYVSETGNHRIRKVTPGGTITTLAGSGSVGSTDGVSSAASFNYPNGIAIDSAGNIFVADYINNRIRMVTSAGVVSTLAGNGAAAFADGLATNASFNAPKGVAVDSSGNVFVADYGNNCIRIITTVNGVSTVSTLAGNGADGAGISFNGPSGVAVDSTGNIFVADTNNNRIIKITIPTSWWELDLGQEHETVQIACINKTSAANYATIQLLNNFREQQGVALNLTGSAQYTSFDLRSTAKCVALPVSDIISAQNFYTPDSSLQRIVRGRYVRIENASPGSPFSPTVAGIYDIYGKNLIVGRSVSVSSPSTNYGAWWEVDLGQEYSIKDILYTGTTVAAAIYNRMRAEMWRNFISGSMTAPFPLQTDPATTAGTAMRFIRLVGTCTINHVAAIDVNGIDVAVWKPVRLVSGGTVTFTAFNGLYASAIAVTSAANNRLEIDLGRNVNISAIKLYLSSGSATCTAFNSTGIPVTLASGFFTILNTIPTTLQNYTLAGFKTRYVGITTAAAGATVNNIVVLDTLGRNIIPNSAKGTNENAVYGFTNTFGSAITLPTLYTELDLGEEHSIVSVIVYYNLASIAGLSTIAVKLMDAYYNTVVSTVSATKSAIGDYGRINYNLGQPWSNTNNLLTVPTAPWTPTATECGVSIYDIAVDSSNNIYALLSNSKIRKITAGGTVTDYDYSSLVISGAGVMYTTINIVGTNIYLAGVIYGQVSAMISSKYTIGQIGISALTASITSITTTFSYEYGLARVVGKPILDSANNIYFVSNLYSISNNSSNTTIYKYASLVHTIVTGVLQDITAITIDSNNNLYAANRNSIYKINAGTTTPVLFAGSATNATGYADGTGAAAYFNNITGMAFDSNNILYVADAGNQYIRVVTPDGVVKTIIQTGQIGSLGPLIVDSSKNIYYTNGTYDTAGTKYGTKYNKLTVTSSYDLPFLAPFTNNIGYIYSPSTTNGAEIFDFSLPSEPAYTIGNITNTTFQITSISADNATGFQYSLNGGAAAALGAVPLTITSAAQSYNTLVLYSVNSIGKTQLTTYIQLAPPAPAITLGTMTSTGFSIMYTPVLSPGSGSTYNAAASYRYIVNGFNTTPSSVSGTTTITATFTGYTAGTAPQINIFAYYTKGGDTVFSTTSTVLQVQLAPPAPIPSLVAGSTTDTGFQISWAPVTGPTLSGYTLSYLCKINGAAAPSGQVTIDTTVTPHKATFTGQAATTNMNVSVVAQYVGTGLPTLETESASLNTQTTPNAPIIDANGYPSIDDTNIRGISFDINFGSVQNRVNIYANYNVFYQYYLTYSDSTPAYTSGQYNLLISTNSLNIYNIARNSFVNVQLRTILQSKTGTITLTSPYSNTLSFQLNPLAPTGLAITGTTTTTGFSVSWAAVNPPTGSPATTAYQYRINGTLISSGVTTTTSGSTVTATFTGQSAGAYFSVSVAAVFTYLSRTMQSAATSISVQLAPGAPTLTLTTGSTTTTGFSMQWGGVSVPAGSPYSASYKWTLSNGLTGTTPLTSAAFAGLPFNTTVTATVQATYYLGTTMMNSVNSNTLSVTLSPITVNWVNLLGVPTSTSFAVQFYTTSSYNITGCFYSTNGGTSYTTIPSTSYSYNSTTKMGTATVTGQTAGSTISFTFRFTYGLLSTFTYTAFNITLGPAAPTAILVSQTSTSFVASLPTPTATISYTFKIGAQTLIPTDSTGATGRTNYTFSNILPAGAYITLLTTQNTLNASGVITATSDQSSLAIQLAPPAPTTISLVAGTTTLLDFKISWTAVSTPAGSPYTVSYTWTITNGTATQTGTPITTTSVKITPTFTFNSPITATVKTIYTPNGGGTTLTSAESPPLQVQNVPPIPTGLAITGSPTSTGFSANWTAIAAPGVSGYSTSYIWMLLPGNTTGTATANTATFTGLIAGGLYTLSVYSKYDNTSSALTSVATDPINIQLAPVAPTGLAIVPNSLTSTGFQVSWTAATLPTESLSPAGTPFTVSYTYILGTGTSATTTSTTATFTGLTAGTTQTVTVSTVFTAGSYILTSSPSTISVTLPATNPPLAPTGLALFGTPTVTTFTVSWNKVTDPPAPYVTAYIFQNASGNALTPDSIWPFSAVFQGSISATTLTVTSMISGTISTGMTMTEAAGTIGAQLTGTPGGTGTYTVASQTVASRTITATTSVGRAIFTAGASSYISAFSMYANYTDAAGTVIVSSVSSSSIPVQLAPSAPTGLAISGTINSNTFSVVWNKVIDPVPASGYSTSYEFKKDGSSITPTGSINYTATTGTATFTGLAEGSFINTFNVYAKYTGTTTLTSTPSNSISVQLGPPVPSISIATGITPTNTGFSIQWNNITVPASSPFTLSYSFSGTYTGLQAATRIIETTVTIWAFTVTSLADGGTITDLRITATYTSGSSTLSTQSNTLSVTIPRLPPVIISFTVTQALPLLSSPYWTPLVYTWTLSGGTPTSYTFVLPTTSITFSSSSLPYLTSPYSFTYSPPIPRMDAWGYWDNNIYQPRITVSNDAGSGTWTPGNYWYRPGLVEVSLAYPDPASVVPCCEVYVKYWCPFANTYNLSSNTGSIRSVTQGQLMNSTTTWCPATLPWRLLGGIPATPGTYTISVNNQLGQGRSCTITISEITMNFNFNLAFKLSTTGTAPAYNNYQYTMPGNTRMSPTAQGQTIPLSFSF